MGIKSWFELPSWTRGALAGLMLFILAVFLYSAATAYSSCNNAPNPAFGIEIDGLKSGIPFKQYPCTFVEILLTFSGRFLQFLVLWKGTLIILSIALGAVVRIVYEMYAIAIAQQLPAKEAHAQHARHSRHAAHTAHHRAGSQAAHHKRAAHHK